MRRASWRSVPMMWRPPESATPVSQLDVGTATGHVRGDGDDPWFTSAGDDGGLTLVLLGVEDVVRDSALRQHEAEPLGRFDRDCADQDRAPCFPHLLDLIDDRVELGRFGVVDEVGEVVANHRRGWSE